MKQKIELGDFAKLGKHLQKGVSDQELRIFSSHVVKGTNSSTLG
jgi:hypothetical protein